MIKARKKQELTYEAIMSRVSEYDIYRYYLGRDFQIGSSINSPFREDRNPSFFMGNRGGFIHHTDLKHKELSGNCIQFVEQLFGLNYHEALTKIDKDLGLGITSGEGNTFKRTWIDGHSKAKEAMKETLIQVKSRKFDSADVAYWKKFYITPEECREENIFAVKDLWINKEKIGKKSTELCFGYLYDDKWKIYFPEREKREHKWFTNVPLTHIDGLSNLKQCPQGIIVKSKKDKMVAKKFLTGCVAAVQNESTGCINEDCISFLQREVDDLYIIFDNDKAGVEACMYYNQFGFNYWNVPQHYRTEGIKDIAELVEKHGPEVLRAEVSKKIKL